MSVFTGRTSLFFLPPFWGRREKVFWLLCKNRRAFRIKTSNVKKNSFDSLFKPKTEKVIFHNSCIKTTLANHAVKVSITYSRALYISWYSVTNYMNACLKPHTDEQVFLDKFSLTSFICSCVREKIDNFSLTRSLV